MGCGFESRALRFFDIASRKCFRESRLREAFFVARLTEPRSVTGSLGLEQSDAPELSGRGQSSESSSSARFESPMCSLSAAPNQRELFQNALRFFVLQVAWRACRNVA